MIAASSAGEVRSAVQVPLLWVAIWPPEPQTKLANALVSSVIASMPYVPGNVACSFCASVTSCAQVVGGLVMPAACELVGAVPDPAHPAEPRDGVDVPVLVSLASMPDTRPGLADHEFT